MQSDTDDRVNSDVRASVRLRADRFALYTRVLGCETDLARADLLGVTARTIRRARAGIVGEEFVAKTVAAMQRHEAELAALGLTTAIDELFEVVEVAA